MKYLKYSLCILLFCLLASCSSKLLTVHKIDVQQGNALEAEAVNKVELGMTQEQVQFILGSPLITDSFHPDRWDYIYFYRPGYGEKERRQFTLIFDRGEVIEIDKHNIANIKSDNIPADGADNTNQEVSNADEETENEIDEEKNQQENLSEREQKDLEEAEKQADALEEVLQDN